MSQLTTLATPDDHPTTTAPSESAFTIGDPGHQIRATWIRENDSAHLVIDGDNMTSGQLLVEAWQIPAFASLLNACTTFGPFQTDPTGRTEAEAQAYLAGHSDGMATGHDMLVAAIRDRNMAVAL